MSRRIAILLAFSGLLAAADRLLCDGVASPLGVDAAPRFTWILDRPARGWRQTAYRVLVARDAATLAAGRGDLWDSGLVASEENAHVPYAGPPLPANATCWWMVQVQDGAGQAGPWSVPTRFDTGLMQDGDWHGAQWLAARTDEAWQADWHERKRQELAAPKGRRWRHPLKTGGEWDIWQHAAFPRPAYEPAPLLRTSFTLPAAPVRARLFICGLGSHQAFINGKRVGDHLLDPTWSDYRQRALYVVHDVTPLLTAGGNAIGVELGRGFFAEIANTVFASEETPWSARQPRLRLRLAMELADGHCLDVVSDGGWRVGDGLVRFDDPRLGELHDARCDAQDWTTAAFAADGWTAAVLVAAPCPRLEAQTAPPVRGQVVTPRTIHSPAPGVQVVDFGCNIAGWVRLRLRSPAGTRVLVRFAERPEGDDFWDNGASGYQQFGYICRGDGEELAEPRFSYHGFRQVRIQGVERLTLADVTGIAIASDVADAGSFTCSEPLLERIHAACVRTFRNNLVGIPTDCPHREKLGWLFDAYAAAECGLMNLDLSATYRGFLRTIADGQDPEGRLPIVAPSAMGMGASPLWSAVFVLLPGYLQRYTGDTATLAEHYERMVRFVDGIARHNRIPDRPELVKDVLGDWNSPTVYANQPAEGSAVYATAFRHLLLRRLADIACVLGKTAEAERFTAAARVVQQAFNAAFLDRSAGIYHGQNPTPYRQAANAVALACGMVEDADRATVLGHLVDDIRIRCHGHLDTGLVGTVELLHALGDAGRVDVLADIAGQRTYPGWGHMLLHSGGDTLWEDWAGGASHDHPMLGAIGATLMQHAAGLRPAPDTCGWRHILMDPACWPGLDHAAAQVDTVRGRAALSWRRDGRVLRIDASVPPGCTARLHLPLADAGQALVQDGTDTLWNHGTAGSAPGLAGIGPATDGLSLTVASGTWHLTATGTP